MSLVDISIRRRVTVAMVTLTFVLFGLIALGDLKVNLLPDLSYPTLTVRTEYTGAAPMEVETLITEPVEEAAGVVKNLRKLHSVSRTGQSDVILEFAWGTDMDQAGLEVRDKLELLRLPLEAEPPVLLRFNPSTEPVTRLVLAGSGDGTSDAGELMRLRRYADEELKKRLEPVEGVAAVKVSGGLEDEVQVLIDQDRLAQLQLSIETVIERLAQENVNISGGRIEEGSQRYLVRTINQFGGLDEMRELLIATQAGVPVRLKDIATVSQGYKEREAIIRADGQEAVELAIYKEGDANTVSVADAMAPVLEKLRKELPDGAELRVVEDQSVFIRQALEEVRQEALMGGLFAILVIFLFLRHGWSTFVIGLSLPISIIATFFFMGQIGLDLNVMSLAGLALATGMVVDDSIVVLESIAKARERGLGLIEAASQGTREVSMAVIASTLTTVAVFLPMVFVEGVAGQLFRDQALTVAIALIISLVVSLTLVPMLATLKARAPMAYAPEAEQAGAGHGWRSVLAFGLEALAWPLRGRRGPLLRWSGFLMALPFKALFLALWLPVLLLAALLPHVAVLVTALVAVVGGALAWLVRNVVGRAGGVLMRGYDRLAEGYRRSLPGVLSRPVPVLGLAALAFAGSLALATTLGLDLIPQFAQDRFEVTAKLPPGTRLAETDALVRALQREHGDDPGVRTIYGVSGTGTRLDASPTESGENIARLSVVMERGAGTAAEAAQTERMRKTLDGFRSVESKFGRPQLLSFATPLEIEVRGPELGDIEKAGRELAALLQSSDRFADVKSSVEQGFPEIQIRFDQERAAALGLTTRQIADQVVRKVRGEVATRYSFRDRKIDVLVRAREVDRADVAAIENLIVNPTSENPVTLLSVATVDQTIGPSEIHRVDQSRVAIVSAGLRHGDLATAVQEVERLVAENPLGAEVSLRIAGQNEELEASRNSLLFAFGLAIFLVYLVMASQFESLLHPFVILFTIPLAMVGAVLALWLSGSNVSVVVFIGLILLVGIVVKNAIVLIDKVNQLREAGVPKREALVEGSFSRLRPIVMTTLTTLFGFAPLAFFGGEGAEVRAPMALTVIGGLAVSTLLTLLVIPVVYDLLDRRPDAYYVQRAQRGRRKPSGGDAGLAEEGARA